MYNKTYGAVRKFYLLNVTHDTESSIFCAGFTGYQVHKYNFLLRGSGPGANVG